MSSKGKILLPLMFASVLVAGIFIGFYVEHQTSDHAVGALARDLSGKSNKLNSTLMLIDRYYVDEVSIDSLIEELMPVLMSELDPHSIYLGAEELARANESLEGEFDGVGIVFNMTTDTVVVLNVVAGGPSYKAGVMNGDRIIKIGDSLVAGQKIRQDDIMKMLRGKRGTTVEISVERGRAAELVPITITRDKIPLKSIDAAFMITPETGVIKFSSFARSTYAEIAAALEVFSKQGMKNLVIDLRGNTGGYMDSPVQIMNEFLEDGKLIVYTMDKYGNKVEQFSDGKGRYKDINIAVLIDEGSASSSEILAGAVQDNDRGMVFGRRSFGKGLVQQQIPFSDGSAIRLTTARYYTPTGRSIQKPYDVYEHDLDDRYMHSEMFSADSVRFDDSLKFTTPKGRTVYGGGGIMPDVFVPIDTLDITDYYIKVWANNIIYRYALEYTDKHREQINKINTVEQLDVFLDADKRLLDDFVAYASRHGIAPNYRQIERSRELLKAQIRGYIGQNTPLEYIGFYVNTYKIDPAMKRALDYFENGGLPQE